jgi:tetratricopeptide (TPR) repeat protein
MARSFLVPAALLLAAGCAPAAPAQSAPDDAHAKAAAPAAGDGAKPAPSTQRTPPADSPPLAFIEDDLPAAVARARAEKKALFVDAWAPWCHTCLSMKSYVLVDPSLRPLAERVVFAAIDTDRPESAGFLERHKMSFWPTFFVIDPARDEVLAYWPGAASARELKALVEDALVVMDASAPAGDPRRLLAQASSARAAGEHKRAIGLYDEILGKTDASFARRDDAIVGKLYALAGSGDAPACARFGEENVAKVRGSAAPADFASTLLSCASKLPKGAAQDSARRAAIARLEELVQKPPAESSVDDRADALSILASGLSDRGDAEGARAAHEKRLALMEKAAAEAKTPEMAATYDYGRAVSYVALGRPEEAVRMLEQREKEMPKSYDPPARLAGVLFRMGRLEEALRANGRALALAYGPRRLGYLKLRAEIQGKMGDRAAQIATLREEVAGYEALARGQASETALADARRRLAETEKGPADKKR